MNCILIATDDVGALIWGSAAASLGADIVGVVHAPGAVVGALDCGADIVLLSGPGLGCAIAPLVRAVRLSAPDFTIVAIPAPGEDARDAVVAGADTVLHGLGDRENREAVLGQACAAARTRRALAQSRRRAEEAPQQDRESGTANLALAQLLLENLLARAARQGEPLSVLAIEADALAEIVVAHGAAAHAAVDDELRARIRECVRDYDVVARVPGGGMLVVLSPCDREGAAAVAGRLAALARERLMVLGGARVRLDCSIGIATQAAGARRAGVAALLARVGGALLDARLAGGARIVCAGSAAEPGERGRETA